MISYVEDGASDESYYDEEEDSNDDATN